MSVGGFAALRALSTRNDDPARASRPFDKDRDGFIIGEGAGVLIMEELEFARRRGAKIYAEVAGYGSSGDAFHITAPSEDGDGGARAMRMAVRKAGITPGEVDYINAHGTSTPFNDRLRDHGDQGHLRRARAAWHRPQVDDRTPARPPAAEAGITALALHHQVAADHQPRLPDPDCDLDYVPKVKRAMPMRYALSSSFGFGGTNATLLLKRHDA
jgi:3-oxoacyl-[acyl-carrier-protein] synthase II